MKIIENYNQIDIHPIQSTRLYLQGRPLLSLWSRKRRGRPVKTTTEIELIDSELTSDFVAVDCAGWYFSNQTRHCTAVELMPQSSQFWHSVHFEYDYLTWHPDYLDHDQPVLAYYSTYFKYCELDDFLTFCKIWSAAHKKIIIGLDPTKLKYNYFKWDLVQLVSAHLPNCQIQILARNNFNLLFTIKYQ
jgi:hypothetical protein